MINRRQIVIHHTHLFENVDVLSYLKPNDDVFFDDCLYSQYVFIKKNINFFIDNKIDCILGFSSGLYANEDAKQIYAVRSNDLHDACNYKIKTINDADNLRNILLEMNGFMKVSQIKELLKNDFCHLALHGCCHLNLEKVDRLIDKIQIFKKDLDDGIRRLNDLGMSTSIYVYPYVYSFVSSNVILDHSRFTQVIGSNGLFRIAIEDLINDPDNAKCCS